MKPLEAAMFSGTSSLYITRSTLRNKKRHAWGKGVTGGDTLCLTPVARSEAVSVVGERDMSACAASAEQSHDKEAATMCGFSGGAAVVYRHCSQHTLTRLGT